MGSSDTSMPNLPDSKSPSVYLTHPNEEEKRATWTMSAAEWSGALTLEQYLEREPYLMTVPISRNGGMTHWILTTDEPSAASTNSGAVGETTTSRPLLSSCESIMKTVFVASPAAIGDSDKNIKVTEEISHGIGSVYTCPEFRGRSYASRMLSEVGVQLENWTTSPQTPNGDEHHPVTAGGKKNAICSALWSDIGKKFYAKKGWVPHASKHVEFLAGAHLDQPSGHQNVKLLPSHSITYRNLAKYCAIDEAAVKEKLIRTTAETGKTSFAYAPSHDQMLWHLYRDSYIASLVFPDRDPSTTDEIEDLEVKDTNGRSNSTSSSSSSSSRRPRSGEALRRHPGKPEENEIKGVVVGPEGQRVWAIWTRNFSAEGPASPEKNTLYILRLVVENEVEQENVFASSSQEDNDKKKVLTESFIAVVRAAQEFAAQWSCGRVDLWNPTGVVADLLKSSGLDHEIVDREEASIPSLMWYGKDSEGKTIKAEDVVWVHNEKYCWC